MRVWERTVGHGEGSRSSTSFGGDDFISTELNSLDESVQSSLVGEQAGGQSGRSLGEEREDCNSGVTSNDGNGVFGSGRRLVDGLGGEGGGSDDVEGGDSEQTGGVEYTGSLEDFSTNWDLINPVPRVSYSFSGRR